MQKAKKIFLVGVLILLGLLLVLAGVNLVQLSGDLILYSGVGLLVIAVAYYFLY